MVVCCPVVVYCCALLCIIVRHCASLCVNFLIRNRTLVLLTLGTAVSWLGNTLEQPARVVEGTCFYAVGGRKH